MKKSISTLNFLNVFVTALVFTAVIGYYFFYDAKRDFEHQAERMLVRFTDAQKMLIRGEIHRVIDRIDHLRELSRINMHNTTREKLDTASGIIVQRSKLGQIDLTMCLSTITLNDSSGAFFVFDKNGKIVYFDNNSQLVGANIFSSPSVDKQLSGYARLAVESGDVDKEYMREIPENGSNDHIIVHISHIRKLDLYIGLKTSFNTVDEKIKSAMRMSLKNERHGFNNFGYFFILNSRKTLLMHPYRPEETGIPNHEILNRDGVDVIGLIHSRFLESPEGYVEYIWNRPQSDKFDNKTLYYAYYPDWDWIICTGFYLDELENFIELQRADIRESIRRKTFNLIAILLTLFVLTNAVALYISRRVRRIEKKHKLYLNDLEQYKMILDNSSVVSRTTEKGEITYVNDSFTALSGYSAEEAIGHQHNIIRHPDTPKEVFKNLWSTIKSGNIWKGVIKNRAKSGESYYFNATIAPLKNHAGEIKEFIASGTDVTELLENREKLEQLFITDSLTGLGNRFRLLNDIEQNGHALIALIDIDRFGEFNDLNGQEAGDTLLKELGERLYLFIDNNKQYRLYRLQADVFAILGTALSIDTFTADMRELLQTLTSTHFEAGDRQSFFNFTFGIAEGDSNLLAYADIALQRAKALRRDMLVYDPDDTQITESFQDNINWLTHLKNGLDNNRIVPYYQPILDYKTGKVLKHECLMRLIDEEGKPIPPGAYLSIAKQTKIYPKLTYQIIDKAINVFSELPHNFSVNLTIEDFLNDDTMQFIHASMKQSGVADRMTIEIVESEEMEQYERITDSIERFRDAGVKIAIDDFGVGYSNYDYLLKLQADYIKIDGSIVKRLPHDTRTRALVRSIVEFARKSGIKTIAEFIADEELFRLVQSLNVDYAQGYYIGKPVATPATDIDFSKELGEYIG